MDKELERIRIHLDEALTFFHFKRAEALARKGILICRQKKLTGLEAYFKAQLFIIREDFKKAIFYLNLALKENPRDSFSLNDKGICLAELGRIEEALTYFDKAIKIFPAYRGFYQNKGWALTLKGDYKKALFYFFKALEFDPQAVETLFSIGFCFENSFSPQKARKFYLKALKLVKGKSSFAKAKIIQALKRL